MSGQKKAPAPKSLAIPSDLKKLNHAQLVELRDALKVRARDLRKAKKIVEARELKAIARKVRKLERASRKGAPKVAAKKAPKAAKKAPVKEGHTLQLKKAA